MKKMKRLGTIAAATLLVAGIAAGIYLMNAWPLRFRSELNRFFGQGNWEWVDSEKKQSRMYSVYYRASEYDAGNSVPGSFREWDIVFTGPEGEEQLWTLSDHTMRINHDRYWFFSSHRYSAKQALVQELMEITFSIASQRLIEEQLLGILSQEEVDCLLVDLSYHGGNPPPDFYDELAEQSWFSAQGATAADYLKSDLYDFYIRIQVYDYRAGKLSEEQQAHLTGSLSKIEAALQQAFGADAAYEIYLGEGYSVEYPA